MKKQLMIAAVVSTMSFQALADISISGNPSVTFTPSQSIAVSAPMDITITGTGGNSVVTSTISSDTTSTTEFVDELTITESGEPIPNTHIWDFISINEFVSEEQIIQAWEQCNGDRLECLDNFIKGVNVDAIDGLIENITFNITIYGEPMPSTYNWNLGSTTKKIEYVDGVLISEERVDK